MRALLWLLTLCALAAGVALAAQLVANLTRAKPWMCLPNGQDQVISSRCFVLVGPRNQGPCSLPLGFILT